MSKVVSIKEHGNSVTYTADKIRTVLSGGGTQDWIPEDGLDEITVTANNVNYNPYEDGLVGYSLVKVRVAEGEHCEGMQF